LDSFFEVCAQSMLQELNRQLVDLRAECAQYKHSYDTLVQQKAHSNFDPEAARRKLEIIKVFSSSKNAYYILKLGKKQKKKIYTRFFSHKNITIEKYSEYILIICSFVYFSY
jgi:hypothetical protein